MEGDDDGYVQCLLQFNLCVGEVYPDKSLAANISGS